MGLFSAAVTLIGGRVERPDEAVKRLAGPVSAWHRNEFRELCFLISRGLRPHHRLIDIGCGPLRAGLPLIAYLDAGNYAGFDVRPDCIAEARRRVERRGLSCKRPRIACGTFDIVLPPADVALAFSVFIHLDDDTARAALRFVAGHARRAYANVNLDPSAAARWGDFPSLGRERGWYEAAATEAGLHLAWLDKRPWEARWWWRHEVMVLTPREAARRSRCSHGCAGEPQ